MLWEALELLQSVHNDVMAEAAEERRTAAENARWRQERAARLRGR